MCDGLLPLQQRGRGREDCPAAVGRQEGADRGLGRASRCGLREEGEEAKEEKRKLFIFTPMYLPSFFRDFN